MRSADRGRPVPGRWRTAQQYLVPIEAGWEAAPSAPGAHLTSDSTGPLEWLPASVPGTAAGALRDAGLRPSQDRRPLDEEDWWFRTSFSAEPGDPGAETVLRLDGIATASEVYLNGELLLRGQSMFAAHRIEVTGRLRGGANELHLCCRALRPLLEMPRRPRARWRTQIAADGGLRFHRTMLLGRAPGFAPEPAAVGPWRPVLLEHRRELAIDALNLRSRVEVEGEGHTAILAVHAQLRGLAGASVEAVAVELDGGQAEALELRAAGDSPSQLVEALGEVRLKDASLWWPHTHGDPALHAVRLLVSVGGRQLEIDAGRTGFRTVAAGPEPGHRLEQDGLALHVNGLPIFARGALWTPLDLVGMAPSAAQLRQALEQVRGVGMNMLRLPGTGAYETTAFHDLCDELGIMVWQDLMFANFDYPIADPDFRAAVEQEITQLIADTGGRPSLTVICGNSEVEQQVAMLGLDPSMGRGELFGELLPARLAEAGVDAVYVPSAPCGGDLPFRPDRGVANYYGVGGYRRPLEDARRADVRFASECLAFSNVPGEGAVERLLSAGGLEGAAWKAGVPRDVGAEWDFEDVRDHYLGLRYELDAGELRRTDPGRYLELSRAVSGEVMAAVFGEWRRAESRCAGGLVLWLRDLLPGAGWGLVDDQGEPKVAMHHLRRALAPVAVWMVDEGLGGVIVHAANDRPEPLSASLRVALYDSSSRQAEQVITAIELPGHGQASWDVEALIGRFVDAAWAYRFGPPAQSAIVATLEGGAGTAGHVLHSQAFHFPAGPPQVTAPVDQLGLTAQVRIEPGEDPLVILASERLAYGVRLHCPGHRPVDDAFSVEPGHRRAVRMQPLGGGDWSGGYVSAINLDRRVEIAAV